MADAGVANRTDRPPRYPPSHAPPRRREMTMDRTRSNLPLAALLLAVGYIVGQAVGPRGADAGVAAVREDRVVTMADDNPSRIVVWELGGHRVLRATSFKLWSEDGANSIKADEYAAPRQDASPR